MLSLWKVQVTVNCASSRVSEGAVQGAVAAAGRLGKAKMSS